MTSTRGRPLDAAVTARVLAAALEMVAERGVDRMTMQGLADRAGVPRSTIYRRWPSKTDLLAAAVLDALERDVPMPDTGSTERDLVEWLFAQHRFLATTSVGQLVLQLSTEALTDEDLRELVRGIARERRRAHRAFLARAVAAGDLRADLDLECAVDLLLGSVLLRVLGHQPVDRRTLAAIVRTAIDGIGSSSPPR